jgi:predicted site-specific integrase-resolvase
MKTGQPQYMLCFLFYQAGTSSTVLHPNDGKTPEQELTDNLIAILISFSGQLYGIRSHKQDDPYEAALIIENEHFINRFLLADRRSAIA